MQELFGSSLLNAENAAYLEQIYESYLKDPSTVPVNWRLFFAQTLPSESRGPEAIHSLIRTEFERLSRQAKKSRRSDPNDVSIKAALLHERKQTNVHALIEAYRLLGHLHADIDPLQKREKPLVPELMLPFNHLSSEDLQAVFDAGSIPGAQQRTLKKIIEDLQSIYCGKIASEFMHIPDSPERVWVQTRVENILKKPEFSADQKRHILKRLTAAEGLEKYLAAKYPGAKRFSLEGADTLIVALDELIQKASCFTAKEIVLGMAHRGRLNVLVNILGKSPSQLFDEFEGKIKHDKKTESGDVKYHQGFSSNIATASGFIHLSLAFNPSHLEIVAPVVCGSVRARQERRHDCEHKEVFPIVIHGDASFAGQGVVMETLNMSQTRAFAIGGTIHIIINNQIGFTTSDPKDARSTLYCSDIGKMLEIPIFHVNADDPEAVCRVAQMALEYRGKFGKDVIIDLVGYRRHGHNEADEPAVTQPLMYQIIRKTPTVWQLYSEKLIKEQVCSQEEVEQLGKEYRDILDKRQAAVSHHMLPNHSPTEYATNWEEYATEDWRIPTITAVERSVLKALADKLNTLPEGFVLHPRVKKIWEDRAKMTREEIPMDWGYGETLAYASLLNEGSGVRLTGQDSCRGTFFHRQAVLHNQSDGAEYIPLCHISDNQARFTIYDSLLSEAAVLAFEYGYATTNSKKLVLWEAQFGDFGNEAQVVIDQFISSGQQKWGRLCGLTLLLPHGYEGQGPEHSSARLERYLQLCAEHNIQVCVPSTPAQIFHLLRRQVLRPMRKPLIVMTPKSLLRNKLAVSTLEELSKSSFKPIILEIEPLTVANIKRVILCSGKVYYDLLERRQHLNCDDITILRIEQLYPFPEIELKQALLNYAQVTDIIWCQEEPQNQGAWYSSQHHLLACLSNGQDLRYVGRKPAAAPAVGYHHLHEEQQEMLLKEALG